jgi:Tol biopolymer transport system component
MIKKLNLAILLVLSFAVASDFRSQGRPKFSDWGPVERLAPPINSEFDDQAPILSKDEKTLFFTSTRPGGSGGEDIWVSVRQTPKSSWQTPVNLGPVINTPRIERLRSITADGRVLLFMSDRAGSNGDTDIWATVRKHVNDDTSWSEPVNLGTNINSVDAELAARYLFADSGRIQKLFFSSSKPGGFGGPDIYESNISSLGFDPAVNVFELNSASVETCFWIRDDGLELIFISNRPELTGNLAYNDIWVSVRDSTYERWSSPTKLGPDVNAVGYQDVNPSLSADGRTLLFASRRPGGIGPGTFDIYITTRQRVAG